jgi:hypothetical protein
MPQIDTFRPQGLRSVSLTVSFGLQSAKPWTAKGFRKSLHFRPHSFEGVFLGALHERHL